MFKLIEDKNEGLVGLVGQRVEVWCVHFFYEGVLSGVNEHEIKLDDCYIVYNTGAATSKQYETSAQPSKNSRYIRIGAIESYCLSTKTHK